VELYGYVQILVLTVTEGEDTVLWNCMAVYRYWYREVLKERIPYCGTVWLVQILV